MLNIGKLAPGGEDYYLDTVASSVEDYYTGHGEAPGRWIGSGAGALGLSGVVSPEVLRAVLGARHPGDGTALLAQTQRKIPGFDLTFRAPKSVSLLWALGAPEVSLEVKRAHEAAVAAALGCLERNAAYTRRGKGGAEQVPIEGFVAAAFRHRTSRADDPLLHTHVLVANLGRTADDGGWRTLDARHLYLHAKTAGFLYQAQLRRELDRRLGVEWAPVTNGYADLEGVPRSVIEAFSRRRSEILAYLDDNGHSSAKAAQVATLKTRRPKSHAALPALHQKWQVRADELGFTQRQIRRLTGRETTRAPTPQELQDGLAALLAPSGLTAQTSTFDRRDVLQGWCELLRDGADIPDIEQLADWVLDPNRDDVIALNDPTRTVRPIDAAGAIRRRDGSLIAVRTGYERFSTAELLAIERRLVAGAVIRKRDGVGIVPDLQLERALWAQPALADEQVAAVRHLTTSGAGVDVVVGKAGSGKTFMLSVAHDAWRKAGYRVIGCSLAARAARELERGSGIPSTTIDRLLADVQRPEGALSADTILVIDEAGMVGTRTLARILEHADGSRTKIVLVGDPHQLPEIDAGGAFAGLVRRLPVAELSVNRRQIPAWERDALDELRDGDIAQAVAAYVQHGRVTDVDELREQLVGDWWQAVDEHDLDAVMVALRRVEVADLNERARDRLAASGALTGPALTAAGREFRAGDRIVCLRNRRRPELINGTRGDVLSVDTDRRTLTFLPAGTQRPLVVPAAYLDAGHVDHGYAITAHKAQGMTCDATFVLAGDAIYREWGYVALSRGRLTNRIYTKDELDPDRRDDPTHPHLHQRDHPDGITATGARLRRSRREDLALDHLTSPGTGDDGSTADRSQERSCDDDRALGLG